MRIYTRTGDDGTTGLFGGNRVPKDDLRIESYGTVDELNSFIGRLLEHKEMSDHLDFFREVQADLFTIGSHLATIDEKMKQKLPSLNPENIEKSAMEVTQPTPVSKPRGRPPGKRSKNQFGRKSSQAKKDIARR